MGIVYFLIGVVVGVIMCNLYHGKRYKMWMMRCIAYVFGGCWSEVDERPVVDTRIFLEADFKVNIKQGGVK
jgi:hypothetical protein